MLKANIKNIKTKIKDNTELENPQATNSLKQQITIQNVFDINDTIEDTQVLTQTDVKNEIQKLLFKWCSIPKGYPEQKKLEESVNKISSTFFGVPLLAIIVQESLKKYLETNNSTFPIIKLSKSSKHSINITGATIDIKLFCAEEYSVDLKENLSRSVDFKGELDLNNINLESLCKVFYLRKSRLRYNTEEYFKKIARQLHHENVLYKSWSPFMSQYSNYFEYQFSEIQKNIIEIQNAITHTVDHNDGEFHFEMILKMYNDTYRKIKNDYTLYTVEELFHVHKLLGGYSYIYFFAPYIKAVELLTLEPTIKLTKFKSSINNLLKLITKDQKKRLLEIGFRYSEGKFNFHSGANFRLSDLLGW
ncbi:uncharacterized protein ASCRUDRAFT_8182 [Ascoidea rubescens DSM 1968]|uniref:Uncharacterized protein n=1 Tax=Ascoidea rubescens DSM 1968 TaxID=1344418 RepID=A0A1D2VHW7_9ASCO|nr:hypothetical protein ASCRUDRAFT_8182 [Ascoidea rubescens DSM 1968]ODV61251.1 hypothetical protein ASCRUDRAFT_8182 [Ascoidea rubescens DSM 1968]